MTVDLEIAIARALVRSRGAALTADDDNWPREVARYRKMAAKHGEIYTACRSLITDAFRDARTVLAEIEAQGRAIFPVDVAREIAEADAFVESARKEIGRGARRAGKRFKL